MLLALLMAGSLNIFAWDQVGHKITAIIAWEQMRPDVRDKVFKILLDAPEDSHLSVPYDAFTSRSDEIKRLELFMFASIWPDFVRNRSFENRHKLYNQGNWHYAAIFWEQKSDGARILEEFRGSGGIAVPKLTDFEKTMRDPSYKDEEKALAIAWYLHVAGDLHNPLHNASRVTEKEPEGDQGGNLFVLVPRTETSFGVNLHSYWDSIIGRVKPRKNDEWDTDYLRPIARKFMKKHPVRTFDKTMLERDYNSWNREGFAFLHPVVYDGVERGNLPSKKYRKRAFKLARKQITLAGYRIGNAMNALFSENQAAFYKHPCEVIRVVRYPISKRRTLNQKLRIALLNVCPPNRGMVARPVTSIKANGNELNVEFDVIRVFDSEAQAKEYAAKNKIEDAVYN
ncbi:MAG: hypothetical protein HKN33_02375 [Pyrinomonadaceae bacterium]|nr:hypothetical protein [Pyrinomonadaceae bacterium]